MSNRFHLAVPVLDLVEATSFYCDFLACTPGSCEAKKWQDINFWGNELTLHYSNNSNFRERHNVDMREVCVPHFGIHLIREDFNQLKERIINNKNIAFFFFFYLRFLNDPRDEE